MKFPAFIFLSFVSGVLTQSSQSSADVKEKLLKSLRKLKDNFQTSNTGLGVLSRSLTIAALSRKLNGDDADSVQKDLHQAMMTLILVDIGGGIVAPLLDDLLVIIATDEMFSKTRSKMKAYAETMSGLSEKLGSEKPKKLAEKLKSKKNDIIQAFKNDVTNLPENHSSRSPLKKAKILTRVKFAGNVIVPLFDVISIYVNANGLRLAIGSCATACNKVAIATSTFGLVSGMLGFASTLSFIFFASSIAGPVLGIAAAITGIIASSLELSQHVTTYPSQETLDMLNKEATIRHLDIYSRESLYNINKFLSSTEEERYDLYFANLGHLVKFPGICDEVINLQFGKTPGMRPRKERHINHKCSTPSFEHSEGINSLTCPYLVEGEGLQSPRDNTNRNRNLGYSFYGFINGAKDYKLRTSHSLPADQPYVGSTVLISTNQLAELGNVDKLRGLDIDTGAKGGDDGAHDDLVSIGDIPAFVDNAFVKIRMGKGNDALNINGRLGEFSKTNVLDADLGTHGHNSLNFGAIRSDSPIKGVRYDASTGSVQFKYQEDQIQELGFVKNVQYLVASPFSDEITMYAKKSGENGIDFTVLKIHGLATYLLDVSKLRTQSYTRHFQINDNSKGENNCDGHVPILKLTNFYTGAKANDILFNDGKIHIYGNRKEGDKRQHVETISQKFKVTRSSVHKRRNECPGEEGGNQPVVRVKKDLLATIRFNTICPGAVEAIADGGECVMKRRRLSELDTTFFLGRKETVDFTVPNYHGTSSSDYFILKCPSGFVKKVTTIDLKEDDSDYLLIGNEMFLKPCELNEETAKLTVTKEVDDAILVVNQAKGQGMKFIGYGTKIKLKGVDMIINENGDVILDLTSLRHGESRDVLKAYRTKTTESLARIVRETTTEEVQNDILTCIKDTGTLSDTERDDLCE